MAGTTNKAQLVARGIRAGYGGPAVFEDLDLTVSPGEAIGLLGRSGVGKSTLIEVLAGRFPATFGTVTLGGKKVHKPSLRDRKYVRAALRVVHQNGLAGIDPTHTVERILKKAHDEARAAGRAGRWDPEAALAQVALPIGVVTRRVGSLSGGERQRLALAKALGTRPDILLLDEPLTAVDPAMRRELSASLVDLVRDEGMGVLVASHDVTMLEQLTSTVHVLAEGALVESGPLRALVANPQHPDTRELVESLPEVLTPTF